MTITTTLEHDIDASADADGGLPMALLESHAQGWTQFLGRQSESAGGPR